MIVKTFEATIIYFYSKTVYVTFEGREFIDEKCTTKILNFMFVVFSNIYGRSVCNKWIIIFDSSIESVFYISS